MSERRELGLPRRQQPGVPPEVVGPVPGLAALALRAKRPAQSADDMLARCDAGVGDFRWPERKQPLKLGAPERD